MRKLLITGINGFLGFNFLNIILNKHPEYKIVGVDKIVDNFGLHNITKHKNYQFYLNDIADDRTMDRIFKIEKPDFVINLAAESFVDKSIINAQPFIYSNVLGIQVLIDMCVRYEVKRLIHTGTDEEYGHLDFDDEPWSEQSICKPRNPYSVSKHCGTLLLHAANQTHGLQYNITRSVNIYGMRQPPRNLIPMAVNGILNNLPITVYGDGSDRRCWDFVENKCQALLDILHHAPPNEIYNLGPGEEMSNLEMVNSICDYFGKGKELIIFTSQRLGIDKRYSTICDKIKSIGYVQPYTFEQGFQKTMDWYRENATWYFGEK